MAVSNDFIHTENAIQNGIDALSQIVEEFLKKNIELVRVCRTAVLLMECGVNPFNAVFNELVYKCIKYQRKDGGWTDVEETLWCTTFLAIYENYLDKVYKAINWLEKQEHKDGCWGKSVRDFGRIPLTSLLLCFLPQLKSETRLKWLEDKWCWEQKLQPNLTYKAALTIMAFSRHNFNPEHNQLLNKTLAWICGQQNEDGGWGPWRNHPIGSDPWCTGICLVSLLHFPDILSKDLLNTGLKWIMEKQLSTGLWAYHYIEDGSAWALYALTKGSSILSRRKND